MTTTILHRHRPPSWRVSPRRWFDKATWRHACGACRSTRARQAQLGGEIATHIDCTKAASLFWIGWEGAVLRAKLQRKPEPLHVFAEGFFALVTA